ncbi:endolytic transglycosylase MltG [Rhodoferax sp. PAMC 29310]|uniref:endolytic transglycosylase MltG n=1 Tax=Rhodoferax sp. PAMC 29310 TaxID=2822760 RepID=UPI001B3409AA|nr:endolytic transglycosylase MltG [Rhodoferax sp. PAMC 29310]
MSELSSALNSSEGCKAVRRLLFIFVLAGALLGGYAAWWLHHPLVRQSAPLDLLIQSGASARAVAESVVEAGAQTDPTLLYWWFRLSGDARQIKAGSYEIETGTTPRRLLEKLVNGEQALRSVTLIEGWTFSQVLETLSKAEHLAPDSKGLKPDLIMSSLGKPGVHPEGRLFPDTYTYAKGSSDLGVLKTAMLAMDRQLEAAWKLRASDSPLKTPEQMLVLASIVEKETGRDSDRAEIAGVFVNRLRIGMMLQTDPTVIYGLGDTFDGNLRRRHLLADTPWNTYTRTGLPPTPISMPGKSSLMAAVQPAQTKAIYFVARGDGTSQFSATLAEHNRAVNKYQRGQ